MGLFTKNTMSIDAMVDLVTYAVLAIIVGYVKHGVWADAASRTEILNHRLEQRRHQASFWKLSKLALLADNVARFIAADELLLAVVAEGVTDVDTQNEVAALVRTGLFQANLV